MGSFWVTLAPRVSKDVTGRIFLGLLIKCSDTEVLTSVQKWQGVGERGGSQKGKFFCEKSCNWDEQAIGNLIWNIHIFIVAAAKSLQSCPTLCDLIDGSPSGSSVPGILPSKNTGVGCYFLLQCMHAKSLQSCPTLCDAMDSSPPGSSVHGIL